MSRDGVIDILAAFGIIAIVGGITTVVVYTMLQQKPISQNTSNTDTKNIHSSNQTKTKIDTGVKILGNVSGSVTQTNQGSNTEISTNSEISETIKSK